MYLKPQHFGVKICGITQEKDTKDVELFLLFPRMFENSFFIIIIFIVTVYFIIIVVVSLM